MPKNRTFVITRMWEMLSCMHLALVFHHLTPKYWCGTRGTL